MREGHGEGEPRGSVPRASHTHESLHPSNVGLVPFCRGNIARTVAIRCWVATVVG